MTHRISSRGFTLIELLIVVAIIAILAAIAVPNFLEAQMRAKIARIQSDMRTLSVAIEAYRTDNIDYPVRRNTQETASRKPHVPEYAHRAWQMSALTTPIAYINTLFVDIFDSEVPAPNNLIDYYDPTQASWLINYRHAFRPQRRVSPEQAGWILVSVGPDGWLGATDTATGPPETPFDMRGTVYTPYDPTNGTVSTGNIYTGQKATMDQFGPWFIEKTL